MRALSESKLGVPRRKVTRSQKGQGGWKAMEERDGSEGRSCAAL